MVREKCFYCHDNIIDTRDSRYFLVPSPRSVSITRVELSWKNSVMKSSHHLFEFDSDT